MKNFRLFLILVLFSGLVFGSSFDVPIGKERIISPEYPKFLLNTTFNTMRYGGITNGPRGMLSHTYGMSFGFDVQVYKYFHAGATLGILTNFTNKVEPIHYRFNMFARPVITFFDCLTLFTRLGGGLGIILDSPVETLKKSLPDTGIGQKYHSKYYGDISPGVHGLATIGIEYFPFSRLGLSLEWGILAEYLHISKSEQQRKKLEKLTDSAINDDAPSSFGYFAYEFPISLNLNIIF